MAERKPAKILIALDTLIGELYDQEVPAQVAATWLLPVFAHVQGRVRGPIPERVAELSRLVGIDLAGEEN